MDNFGFQLLSDFDHHLETFLVMVQSKRKVNTSREVTAADLVDLRRATELFREVVPLLRAELEELKRELLGTDGISKRKKKVVTFAENRQSNPFKGSAGQQSEVQPEVEVANQERTPNSAVKAVPEALQPPDKTLKKPAPINWDQLKTYKPRTPLPPCYLCGGHHSLYNCDQFRSWSFAERLKYIQRNRLCVNCFSQKHTVAMCREVPRCKICAEMHSTLLHWNS